MSCPPARERVIGWYHTGPRLREADIDIHALMARYCDNPLLVICEFQVGARLVARQGAGSGGCNRGGWPEVQEGRADKQQQPLRPLDPIPPAAAAAAAAAVASRVALAPPN